MHTPVASTLGGASSHGRTSTRMSKLAKSLAKPFKPGWKPQHGLRPVAGEGWRKYARRNRWFVIWLSLALCGLLAALAAFLSPCDPVLTPFSAPSELMVIVDGACSSAARVVKFVCAAPACATPSLTLARRPPSALPAGSNSIGRGKRPAEVVAAQVFVQEFASALPAPVRAGVVQFSGRGIGGGAAADSARLEIPLTTVNKTG